MAMHRLGLQIHLLFKPSTSSFGRVTLITHPPPLFAPNARQFTSRPRLQAFWRRSRVHQVLRAANNAIPVRGARTLRRGLVPGSLAYNAGKCGEANVERGVVGAAPVGTSVTGKAVP